ncbi:MAG: AmmeMemoRadiSam system protein B, partial [Kiritimatiellae bacterium]|nr:AmmeMemoRadiSam system protein B [Kiritimatiellia bacterium]
MNTLRTAGILLLVALGLSCRPAPAEDGTIRPPAVAGSFYPAAPDQLARDVDAYLAAAPAPVPDTPPVRVLVVPHAGYVYSRAVAAHAYRLIADQPFSTVVLIGSSHRAAFPAPALWP